MVQLQQHYVWRYLLAHSFDIYIRKTRVYNLSISIILSPISPIVFGVIGLEVIHPLFRSGSLEWIHRQE